MKLTKKREKAQQLVEFLLVVPFMIIILGIMTEYAYALNVNMTLTGGLKAVASSVYSDIKPWMTKDDIRGTIKTNFIQYLKSNNVPANEENNIQVGYAVIGQTAVFTASYDYIPAFTLPNVYFRFLPEKFNFFATAAVPSAFIGNNHYNTDIDSEILDNIWGVKDFTSQDSFNTFKKGIMKDPGKYRDNILFLLQNPAAPGLTKPYVLISWDGKIKTAASGRDYNVDLSDGRLYECSDTICGYSGEMFLNHLKSHGYYNIIFIHDIGLASLNDLGTSWAYDKSTHTPITVDNSTDISLTDVDGVLKRMLALVGTDNLSMGDYDFPTGNTYSLLPLGSMVFIKTPAEKDYLKNMISGENPKNYDSDYNFGSKVN